MENDELGFEETPEMPAGPDQEAGLPPPEKHEEGEPAPAPEVQEETAFAPPPPPVEEPEDMPAPEVPPMAPEPPAEPEPTPWVRRVFRWAIGLLIIFGLGAVVALLAFYLPASRDLRRAQDRRERAEIQVNDMQAQLDNQAAEFETQLNSLQGRISEVEAERDQLQEELNLTSLQARILSALADVRSAQLALEQEDPARARVHLSNTPDTLVELETLVGPDQVALVVGMQERLDLAIGGLEEDTFAAQSDLDVLANNLTQLENIFFAGP